MYKKRLFNKGNTLITVIIVILALTSAGIYFMRQMGIKEKAVVGLIHKEKLVDAMKVIFKSGIVTLTGLYQDERATFDQKLANSSAVLSSDGDLSKISSDLPHYSYNFYITDNDDGDSNNASDSDGRVFLEVRVVKGDFKKSMVSLVSLSKSAESHPPTALREVQGAFNTCFEENYRIYNTLVDLVNNDDNDDDHGENHSDDHDHDNDHNHNDNNDDDHDHNYDDDNDNDNNDNHDHENGYVNQHDNDHSNHHDNDSDNYDIYLYGMDYMMNGNIKSGSSYHRAGFWSNGAFTDQWFNIEESSLPNIGGFNNENRGNAVTEATDANLCDKYTNLENKIASYIQNNISSSEVIVITPATTSVNLLNKKIIVFDASGGGFLQVYPSTFGGSMTLGTAENPVLIYIKGRHPRCTANTDALSADPNCNFANGDGTIRFNGNLNGYGVFLHDASTEITGNFTWRGFFHSLASNNNGVIDNEDFGRVFEITGNCNILGAMLFNRPIGDAAIGDAFLDAIVNLDLVINGEESYIKYSHDAIELAASLLDEFFPNTNSVLSFFEK